MNNPQRSGAIRSLVCRRNANPAARRAKEPRERLVNERRLKRALAYDIFFSIEQQRAFGFSRAFHWINALRSLLHFAHLRRIKATKIAFENFGVRFALGKESYPKEVELFSGAIAEAIDKDPLFFGAGHILKGAHVARLNEVRINKVKVWFNYLGAWMGEGLQDQHLDEVTRIEYRRPEDRTYQISPNVTLRLCHSHSVSVTRYSLSSQTPAVR